ncbi:PREDICTED: shugoshin-1 isoform X10 [Populus euphratica]|uniref:Shugoshin-1 isoform X10 n=1 Tax=Populus euphratica TaxID=75702 RepID=A0AAJ6XMG3_POPEU|nr:PREDICTED: shugoshin-1 isoform X10 [Populus euphratica]
MEGVPVLDTENINVAGVKIKGERLEKGSLVGIAQRKTLVDINSFPAQRKMLADISNLSQRNQYGKSQSVLVSKEHVEKLQRDIMALTKLVADRNKIIELSAIELQKLRFNYQQLQQQNLQLAQTNSQMLAELNAGKDKLKACQHELGCKNGLLNAKKLELKEKTKKVRSQNMRNEVETIKGDKAAQFSQPEDNKPCNTKRKRQSKVQSLDSSAVKPGQTEENVEKKSVCLRRQSAMFKFGEEPTEKNIVTKSVCLRRQSARLKSGEEPNEKYIDTKSRICTGRQSTSVKSEDQLQEPAENLFQKDDANFHIPPLHDDPVRESCPTSSVTSVKIESETGNSVRRFETQELRRTSFRPTRRAAEKVQTYKEIPLNAKMRRSE